VIKKSTTGYQTITSTKALTNGKVTRITFKNTQGSVPIIGVFVNNASAAAN
jgi:hypothetical protein